MPGTKRRRSSDSSPPCPSPTTQSTTTTTPPVYRSTNPIHDRDSTFTAAFIPSTSPSTNSRAAALTLQADPAFADATHKMTAWRFRGHQQTISGVGVLDLGHDDDGETYGGSNLERLLDRERVEGAVCVARWFGGTMLGKVRFEHIRAVAAEAIEEWRKETEGVKRRKVEEEEKPKLVGLLLERDESVRVLRGMLLEKSKENTGTGRSAGGDGNDVNGGSNETQRMRDIYEGMEITLLRKMEKARDRTIEVLLGKIDAAERAQDVKKDEKDEKRAVRNEQSDRQVHENAAA